VPEQKETPPEEGFVSSRNGGVHRRVGAQEGWAHRKVGCTGRLARR
jgi:hypothetical protein